MNENKYSTALNRPCAASTSAQGTALGCVVPSRIKSKAECYEECTLTPERNDVSPVNPDDRVTRDEDDTMCVYRIVSELLAPSSVFS